MHIFFYVFAVLDPPTNLDVQKVDEDMIRLTWTRSTDTGVDGYKVYYHLVPNEFLVDVEGPFREGVSITLDQCGIYSITIIAYSDDSHLLPSAVVGPVMITFGLLI